MRNLEERSAVWVAKHLVMAGRLIDVDPELAFQHALAASRRGGRLAAVREAVGVTAYAAGHYGEALREFRTFRRISGSNVHLPVMADCERGLGRPDRALDLARSEEVASLDAEGKTELAMVVSGARADLGQLDAAVAALQIPQLDLHRAFSFSPRLFRAYADALDAAGRSGESDRWRRQAGVAERALGVDDDLEPDIIDLGEDDEPVPSRVPRVADVLGTEAAVTTGSAGDASDGAADKADADKADADKADAADADADEEDDVEEDVAGAGAESVLDAGRDADRDADPAGQGEAEESGLDADADVEIPGPLVEDHPELDVDKVEKAAARIGTAVAGNNEAAAPGFDVPAAGAPTSQEQDAGPIAADAVPAGETSAPVRALQTEMLFSMDDLDAADFPDAAAKVGTPASSPVKFSVTGTVVATDEVVPEDPAMDGAAGVDGAEESPGTAQSIGEGESEGEGAAPERRRTTRPTASQDVVDE